MSEIRVDQIKDQAGTGAPAYTYGIEVPVGVGITGAGGINVSGMVTAGAGIDGNATGLTGTPNITVGVATGTSVIVGSAVTINSTGIDAVSGVVTATNFVGGGANITALSGSNIASGTVAAARVATLNQNTSGTAGGLSGTPDITIRNIVAVAATFSGTVTYENMTNQDVIGLGTYRTGLNVGSSEGGGVGVAITLSNDGNAVFGRTGVVTATTFKGNIDAVDGDFDGTLEADAITVNGTALNTVIQGTTVNNASVSALVTVADESSDTTCFPTFVTAATGDLAAKTGTNLTFDSANGKLAATQFVGVATGGTDSGATVGVGTTATILGVTQGATQNRFSGILVEKCSIQATNVAASQGTIDLAQGNVHYYTSNGSGATTADIIYKGGNNLSNYLRTGESVQVQVVSKPNNSEYINAVTVDGGAVTEEWSGGSAPSSASSGGYDVTTITLIKIASTGTPNNDYLVLCAVLNYA